MTCDSSHYHIYTLDRELGAIHFTVSKSIWTPDEIHDMAETLKAFAMDADKALLDRIDK